MTYPFRKVELLLRYKLLTQCRYSSEFSAASILSDNNIKKCIECIQKKAPIQMKWHKSETEAAILVPICVNDDGEVSLLYTKRSGKLSRHVRQVSFPGSSFDGGVHNWIVTLFKYFLIKECCWNSASDDNEHYPEGAPEREAKKKKRAGKLNKLHYVQMKKKKNYVQNSLLKTTNAHDNRVKHADRGGIKDSSDVSYEDCALRETEEEIGLDRSRVKICGTGVLLCPPRTASIMPVIGIVKNLSISELKLNHNEVDEVFMVPISKLASKECRRHTQFRDGYSNPSFCVDNYKVWGITGAMTHNLLSCLLPNYDKKIPFVKMLKNVR